jgi:hypothetical protein
MSSLTFMSCMSTAILAPFYPLEVKDHGIDIVWVGFVIG